MKHSVKVSSSTTKDSQQKLARKISISVILLFSVLFLLLIKLVFIDHDFFLDNLAAGYAEASVSNLKTNFFYTISYLGSQQFLIPAYSILIIIFLLIKRFRKYSWRILLTVLIGTGMMFGFKYLFGRDRPLEPLIDPASGHSFPSGHSFSSLLFFSILLFLALHIFKPLWKKYLAGILLIGLSLLVGMSRVYLGVHYVTDVLAGFCLAIVWIFICELILFKQLPLLLSVDQTDAA